mgnify:CR=1 FL=1
MIIFDRYEQNKGKHRISPALLWEYSCFTGPQRDSLNGFPGFPGSSQKASPCPFRRN